LTDVIARFDAPAHAPKSLARRHGGAHRKPRVGGFASRALIAPTIAATFAVPVAALESAATAAPAAASTSGPSKAVSALFRGRPAVTAGVVARPAIHTGSSGGAVIYIQRLFGVRATGHFRVDTLRAVTRLQRVAHLRRTGVVDRSTWAAVGITARSTPKSARTPLARAVSLEGAAPGSAAFGQRVLAEARRDGGGRYVYGGSTPAGFDCSGYVSYVYRHLGISLPHSAAQIRARVSHISASSVRAGDLVFVTRGGVTSHVAIYAGRGVWYEASNPSQPVGLHRAWTSSVNYGRVSV